MNSYSYPISYSCQHEWQRQEQDRMAKKATPKSAIILFFDSDADKDWLLGQLSDGFGEPYCGLKPIYGEFNQATAFTVTIHNEPPVEELVDPDLLAQIAHLNTLAQMVNAAVEAEEEP